MLTLLFSIYTPNHHSNKTWAGFQNRSSLKCTPKTALCSNVKLFFSPHGRSQAFAESGFTFNGIYVGKTIIFWPDWVLCQNFLFFLLIFGPNFTWQYPLWKDDHIYAIVPCCIWALKSNLSPNSCPYENVKPSHNFKLFCILNIN